MDWECHCQQSLYIYFFGLLLFHAFKERRVNFSYLKHPVVATVTAYLAWLWLSSIFSSMPTVSFKFTLARTWYISLFFYWGLFIFNREDRVKFFLNWFTIFTMIMVCYTLFMHAKDGFSRGQVMGFHGHFFLTTVCMQLPSLTWFSYWWFTPFM